MTPRRAALYLRVSTDRQADDDRFGLDVQSSQIRAYAERQGFTPADTFTDTITGTRHRREHLDQLLDQAAAYDAVIISSVDRLGRRNRIIYSVLDELLDTGLEVHSTDMGLIDPEDEGSMLTFGVRSLFAESDHRRLTQKLYRAKVAKVTGNPLTGKPGQPANPLNRYGWKKGEPVPHEQEWVRHMYQRLQVVGTMTLTRELRDLGILTRQGTAWTPTKIRLIVKNPLYKGTYEFGHHRKDKVIVARCAVPAIVSEELWDSVNRRMSERNGKTQARVAERREVFQLTGHIRCGACQRAMTGLKSGRKQYGYYRCGSSAQPSYVRTGPVCEHQKLYRADVLHDAVQAALRALALDDDAVARALHRPVLAAPDHRAALADLARRAERLEAAYLAGAYTPQEYAERRGQVQAQRHSVLTVPAPTPLPPAATADLPALLRQALALPLSELAQTLGLRVLVAPGGEVHLTLDPLIA